MSKWHAHVAHMAKDMNMVGEPGPGLLAPPLKSGADLCVLCYCDACLSLTQCFSKWAQLPLRRRF